MGTLLERFSFRSNFGCAVFKKWSVQCAQYKYWCGTAVCVQKIKRTHAFVLAALRYPARSAVFGPSRLSSQDCAPNIVLGSKSTTVVYPIVC